MSGEAWKGSHKERRRTLRNTGFYLVVCHIPNLLVVILVSINIWHFALLKNDKNTNCIGIPVAFCRFDTEICA